MILIEIFSRQILKLIKESNLLDAFLKLQFDRIVKKYKFLNNIFLIIRTGISFFIFRDFFIISQAYENN